MQVSYGPAIRDKATGIELLMAGARLRSELRCGARRAASPRGQDVVFAALLANVRGPTPRQVRVEQRAIQRGHVDSKRGSVCLMDVHLGGAVYARSTADPKDVGGVCRG